VTALGDIPNDEFRARAHELADWIATYLNDPAKYPVLPPLEPGATTKRLATHAPDQGEPLARILADFETQILPGLTHWNHPGFLAYFANTASGPGVLAEFLMAALNVNGMLWRTGPAATELEQVVTDWLRQLLGLSDGWFGMVNDLASTSTLYALAAAREADASLDVRAKGLAGRDLPRLRVYCSKHAHNSIDKAAMTLGLGYENVVRVAVDDQLRMRPDALAAAIAADRAAGYRPIAIVATVGTTSATSVDPVAEIVRVARRESVWLHIDGAYGGIAGVVPELRHLLAGVDEADSFVVNPHKWLFTPMDCSVFYTRRPRDLKRAFALGAAYLDTAEADQVVNYMDYGYQLGRRFRSLKLWMVLRAFGAEGIAARIRHHCELASLFASWVEGAPQWELAAPHPFSTLCFRHVPPGLTLAEVNAHNARILDRVNESGDIFISHTMLDETYVLRVAIGNLRTEESHLQRAWALLQQHALPPTIGQP
jgi:aromatic-L-amino-acid decarboxylase